jgi:hypothetical protein
MADDIAALEQAHDAKFQQILEAVAAELKLGKYDMLSPQDQERVETEAETLAERWMEEAESQPRQPRTPLEQLLAELHAIAMKFPETGESEQDEGTPPPSPPRR